MATDKFSLHRISIDDLRQLCHDYQQEQANTIKSNETVYYNQTWDNNEHGALSGYSNETLFLYDDSIDSSWARDINISFWIKGYIHDLMGRIVVAVDAFDEDGNATSLAWGRVGQFVNAIDGEDGRVHIPVTLPEHSVKLRIAMGDPELPPKPVAYNNLLIHSQKYANK